MTRDNDWPIFPTTEPAIGWRQFAKNWFYAARSYVDTIEELLAQRATAEADADRLAEAMRNTVEEFYGEDGHTYNPDETECLRLHDEAIARRVQP